MSKQPVFMPSPIESPKMGGVSARVDRCAVLDALRGFALVWMTLYHFSFDLNHFGWWHQDFYRDPFWTVQRTLILSMFLLCAGMGQAVAHEHQVAWQRFGKRWGQIALCALLVTAGSAVMFPRSFIYFGVLHGMALMWLVARITRRWGRWLWWAGVVALLLPWMGAWLLGGPLASLADTFDSRWLNWLGLITHKPITEDYVPIFPWMGLFWWGMACGHWLLGRHSAWLARRMPAGGRMLALLGRHSLGYYMLHQPVMIGLLMLVGWALKA